MIFLPRPARIQRKSILLVEDHPLSAQGLIASIRSSFPRLGIVHVTTFEEAKDALARQPFHFVLTDNEFPERAGLPSADHGLRLVQHVRKVHGNLPILVHSAGIREQLDAEVKQAGGIGFTDKLAFEEQALPILRAHLSAARRRQNL